MTQLTIGNDDPDAKRLVVDAVRSDQHSAAHVAARARRDSEIRNYALRSQIYRAIAINLEALDEGAKLARCFSEWQNECQGDSYFDFEYQRLRQKYPQYLKAH